MSNSRNISIAQVFIFIMVLAICPRSRAIDAEMKSELEDHARYAMENGLRARDDGVSHTFQHFARAKKLWARIGVSSRSLDLLLWSMGNHPDFPLEMNGKTFEITPELLDSAGGYTRLRGKMRALNDLHEYRFLTAYPSRENPVITLYTPKKGRRDVILRENFDSDGMYFREDAYYLESLNGIFADDSRILSAEFSENGERFTVTYESGLQVVYPSKREKVRRLACLELSQTNWPEWGTSLLPGIPLSMTVAKSGGVIATLADTGVISLIDTKTWGCVMNIVGAAPPLSNFPDADRMFSPVGLSAPIKIPHMQLLFSRDNERLFVVAKNRAFEISLFENARKLLPKLPFWPAVFVEDEKGIRAFSASAIHLLENDEWKEMHSFPVPENWYALERFFSPAPDGSALLRQIAHSELDLRMSSYWDGRVKLEKWLPGRDKPEWTVDRLYVGALAWDNKGERFAVWNYWTRHVEVYDFSSGKRLNDISLIGSDVADIAFSRDGSLLAVSCYDPQALRVWNLRDGIECTRLQGGERDDSQDNDFPALAAFLPNGALAYSDVTGKATGSMFSSTFFLRETALFGKEWYESNKESALLSKNDGSIFMNEALVRIDLPQLDSSSSPGSEE